MKKKKVINRQNLPTSLPICTTLVAYLMLDKFNAPGWVWGALGVVFLILWASALLLIHSEEDVDIFNENKKL